MKDTVRLKCSNCGKVETFEAKGELPERCDECKMIVGWLPPNENIKDSGCRKTSANNS